MISCHKWESQSEGPFSNLNTWFGGHLGVAFCKFCKEKGFSEAYFSVLLHLQIVKTPSRCIRVVIAMGRGFDNLYPNSQCNGKGFSIRVGTVILRPQLVL